MTTLVSARSTAFTEWVVRDRLLRTPFVLVDAGCSGGIHQRFDILRPVMRAYGFDPLPEEIETLTARETNPDIRYFAMALGDEDGERDIHVTANRAQTSFYFDPDPSKLKRLRDDAGDRYEGIRRVKVRQLDGLIAEGRVPAPDYIKLDVEGHEPKVIAGGRKAFEAAQMVESESGFTAGRGQPECHFASISAPLHALGLKFHSLGFWHSTKACMAGGYLEAAGGRLVAEPLGRIQGIDALFARDLIDEWTQENRPRPVGRALSDAITKACLLFEIFNLNDCAIELMAYARDKREIRNALVYDPGEAIDLLLPTIGGKRIDYATYRDYFARRAAGQDPRWHVGPDDRIALEPR